MRKILVLVGFFIIAVIAGFAFADALDLFKSEHPGELSNSQVNYLLIRVDDLAKPRPTLQTIWGMFISFSDQTSVYFQPIYPSVTTRVDLRSLFTLNQQGKPDEVFLKELEKFNLNLDGYLVLDDRGAQTFQTWLAATDKDAPSATVAPSNGQMSQQRIQLSQVCKGLSVQSYIAQQPMNWNSVFPTHLVISSRIEVITLIFDRVFMQSNVVECHVLD